MRGTVLVAGFATRHVVHSAFRAGYKVQAIDHFCDQDLCWYADRVVRFDDLAELGDKVNEVMGTGSVDYLVTTSGAETICPDCRRLGTPPDIAGRFLDKRMTQDHFVSRSIPVPPLVADGTYPAILKPRVGSGGWRNRLVRDRSEEEAWHALFPDLQVLRQEIVEGIPASVSVLTDGLHAVALAANLQLLRGTGPSPWGFAGSVTPALHQPLAGEMAGIAVKAVQDCGCIGSVGVDFVLGGRTWAIEINPRFQATLDTVELATGENLFSLHARACLGSLPTSRPRPEKVAVRRILFADRERTIREDCSLLAPVVADIPWPGTVVEEGGAIISVYGVGEGESAAFSALEAHERRVRRLLGLPESES